MAHPFSRFRQWLNGSTARRRIMIGACLLLIAAGMALVAGQWIAPAAPNPASASLDEVVPFLASNDFAELDSRQRQRFLDALAQRYVTMDREQRQRLDRLWNECRLNPSMRQELDQQMGLSVALAVVRHWQELEGEERDHYLDAVAAARRTVALPLPFVDHWLSGEKAVRDMTRNEQALSGRMGELQRQYFARTTAPERAAMAEVGRQLLQRQRSGRAMPAAQ